MKDIGTWIAFKNGAAILLPHGAEVSKMAVTMAGAMPGAGITNVQILESAVGIEGLMTLRRAMK